MEEQIDILTKQGIATGKSCPKSIIHKEGHYHNTAHIWLYTRNSEILLQQRSLSKLICPGLWDVSVAGHVDAGETVEEAALRETREELGLGLNKKDLKKVGVFECFQSYENGILDNEFHNTFIAELTVPLKKLSYPMDEVEDIKLVSLIEFKELLKDSDTNNHFVATNRDYYLKVLKKIEAEIYNT